MKLCWKYTEQAFGWHTGFFCTVTRFCVLKACYRFCSERGTV